MSLSASSKVRRPAQLALPIALACFGICGASLLAQAEAPAKLSFHIVDTAGVSHAPAFEIYEAGGLRYGQTELRMDDVRGLANFISTVRAGGDPVSSYLRSQLYPNGVPAETKGLTEDEQDAANESFIAALNKVLATGVLFDAERFAKVTPTLDLRAQVAVLQQAGAQLTLTQLKTFNRVALEAAYPGIIVRCSAVFTGDDDHPEAVLPAGEYWLVPLQNPLLLRRVTVKPGETLDASSPAPNHLWLSVLPAAKSPPQLMLVQLKPAAERQAMLAAYRTTSSYGALRPGVPEAERDDALRLARREFERLTSAPFSTEGLAKEEQNRRNFFHTLALANALRILAVAGEVSDASLIASAKSTAYYERNARASAVAYLESRLGRLSQGELASRLKGADPEWATIAALQLHIYGLTQGETLLRQALQNPAMKTGLATWIPGYVGDDGSPAMVEAVRANYELEAAPPTDATTEDRTWPAARYLLAYGNKQDLARVGRTTWTMYHAGALIPQLADPMPIVKVMAKNYQGLAVYEAYFRSNPATASYLASQIEKEIFAAAAPGATTAADREPGFTALNTYDASVSYCRPTQRATQLYFNRVIPLNWMTWLPAQWRKDEILDSLCKGNLGWGWESQLDYLPHAELVQELKKREAAGNFEGKDLLLAAHLLISRAFKYSSDYFVDGVERRPFGLQDRENQAAILGLLELRPQLEGKKLTLDFRFRLAPHYNVGSFIDFNEGDKTKWAHHKYVINGGRQLIEKVSLRAGNRSLPLTDLGSKDGGAFLTETTLDQGSLDGVLADADLEFLGQHYTVSFDLFASDCAKVLRRAAAKSSRP